MIFNQPWEEIIKIGDESLSTTALAIIKAKLQGDEQIIALSGFDFTRKVINDN